MSIIHELGVGNHIRCIGKIIDPSLSTSGPVGAANRSTQELLEQESQECRCEKDFARSLLRLILECTKRRDASCNAVCQCGGVELMVVLLTSHDRTMQERGAKILARCVESNDGARSALRSAGALTQLAWLIDHERKTMRKAARRCIDSLRSSPNSEILPFVEQGVVPVLCSMCSSKREETRNFSKDIVGWLKSMCIDGVREILLRTLCMDGNEELRGHISVALVHLCFHDQSARTSFARKHPIAGSNVGREDDSVSTSPLQNTLSMLRSIKGRSYAIEFMYAIEDFIVQWAASISEDQISRSLARSEKDDASALRNEKNFNNPSTSDLAVKVNCRGSNQQTLWTMHAHKAVLGHVSSHFQGLIDAASSNEIEIE